MKNMIGSGLSESWRFVPHTTTRPPKKGGAGEASYDAFFRAGVWRGLKSLWITAWHVFSFPVNLLRSRASVVQIQSSDYYAFWEASAYVFMSRALGRPAVMRFGGMFNTFYEGQNGLVRWVIRRVLASASQIVVLSKSWGDYFAGLTDPAKINVIPNAVRIGEARPEREYDRSPVSALFIANTEPLRKGIDELLEIAPELRGQVCVRCIATPETLRERIVDAGLDDVVVPIGTLDRAELQREYLAADIFLIPSRGEGFPNALLEAMAAGLPIVATPVGAMPEVVVDGENGLVVPVNDPKQLLAATLKLAGDPELRRVMGEVNRKTAEEVYEIDVVFKRYGDLWQRVLGDSSL